MELVIISCDVKIIVIIVIIIVVIIAISHACLLVETKEFLI